MNPDDLLVDDCGDWWLYRLPDGRLVRVDIHGPLRFAVDIEDGAQLTGLTTEQVETTLRQLAGERPTTKERQ